MKKKKNIFLTGDLHVGKSTIVQNVLRETGRENLGGYRIEAIFEHDKKVGFKMVSFSGEERIFAHRNYNKKLRFGDFGVAEEVFENFGADLLQKAIFSSDLIVIDEIGAMERKTLKFQQAILACLDSPIPVLGVVQKRAAWAKSLLEKRNDCIVLEVMRTNQKLIENSVKQMISEILSDRGFS